MEAAMDYLKNADAVATEFNLDDAQSQSAEGHLDMPADVLISDFLNPKQYQDLDRLFQRQMGLSIEHFNNTHPFVVHSLLVASIMDKDMSMALDQAIWSQAKVLGKKLDGLEAYTFQMNLVQEMDIALQVKSLKGIVRNFSNFVRRQKQLVKLYSQAELMKLNKLALKEAGALRGKLVFSRNENMAKEILKKSKDLSYFYAVGGGHLSGKKGILRLLKLAGVTVKPILLEANHLQLEANSFAL